ncbi:MAG: MBL fold metallo-hydrolase [Fidelibacterota bacterium]
MKTGQYEISIINAGFLAMDCGAVFGVVPKALWQRQVQCDEKNRMLMSLNCLLLESAVRKILVDTGLGNGLGEKLRKIYNIQDNTSIADSLAEKGLKPEDITDVLVTHLHFDHAGGLIDHPTKEPFFRNARYYTGKQQFQWAQSPSLIDRASYKKRNYMPLYESGRLQLLKPGEQPFDNIRLYQTTGHTPGMITLEINDNQSPVYYCTDIFPTHFHIPVNYISAYDLHPLDLLREKQFFLKKIQKNKGILIFPHDPLLAAASVANVNNDYQINKTYKTI